MKKRVKKVYKKLPPHSNEAHPLANAGEANKPLVIGIISIVAVVALSLLLLFSDQLIGKAFFTGAENTAGVDPVTAVAGQDFVLKVKANTKDETNTVSFKMSLPSEVSCEKLDGDKAVSKLNDWTEFENKCVDGKLSFTYVSLETGAKGQFEVAEIKVKGLAKGSYEFKFDEFEAYDSKNNDMISPDKTFNPTVEVKEKSAAPSSTSLDECGNGKIEGSEECDKFKFYNADTCINKGFSGGSIKCTSECKIDTSSCTQVPKCTGATPANADICTGSDQGLMKDIPKTAVLSCSGSKCEYTCKDGYKPNAEATGCVSKVPPPPPSVCGDGKVELVESCDDENTNNADGCSAQCQVELNYECSVKQGETKSTCVKKQPQCTKDADCANDQACDLNSKYCIAKDQGLQAPAVVCGDGKKETNEQCDDNNKVSGDGCSDKCVEEPGYSCEVKSGDTESTCTKDKVSTSVAGKKITLTDIPKANNVFATKITATESFTAEVTVYTILYGQNNKVLSIKSEKIEDGLSDGETYTATVNYPETNVKQKSVLVFDVEKNPSIFGSLKS